MQYSTATYFPSSSECTWSNQSQVEAEKCLRHGNFYDGCNKTCYQEMIFLSLSYNEELENVIYGRLFPFLVFLVVVANVLVALVLSQKHMITPTNIVLKYMAVADLCVGLIPLPWTFFYYTLQFIEHEEKLELWWCYMYKYSMDAIPPVCHNIAMWLTVLLAGQRYVFIEYPLESKEICSVKNVRVATIIITFMSIICGLPKSMDYYFNVYQGWAYVLPGRWVYTRTCMAGPTWLLKSVGPNTFFNFYFWIRVIGFIIVPSMLLILLNALLISGIRQAQKRKEALLKTSLLLMMRFSPNIEKRAREAQRQIDSNSTSLMLVMVVSIFLVVNLPQAIFMAMLCICNTFGIQNPLLEGIFPVAFMLGSNMLVMATYPINFGIYCFMSSSFRQTFKILFYKSHWRSIDLASHAASAGTVFSRLPSPRRLSPVPSTKTTSDYNGGSYPPLLTASREQLNVDNTIYL